MEATEEIRREIARLAPWFHNLQLGGLPTAPDHFLGDFPAVMWRSFHDALPAALTGLSVLDIGCNAGFYALTLKQRGAARVVGIDSDDRYLDQARFAASVVGADIEFRNLSVYDVAALRERFDIVLFMGVLYHLRHPLLALDRIHQHVARDLLIFQSMLRGSDAIGPVEENPDFWDAEPFDRPDYPKLHFIEQRYANDPTNWWVPNRACAEAMLRDAGFSIDERRGSEIYICRHRPTRGGDQRI
jgi:tRNA (mo5U34)-methyltransferase